MYQKRTSTVDVALIKRLQNYQDSIVQKTVKVLITFLFQRISSAPQIQLNVQIVFALLFVLCVTGWPSVLVKRTNTIAVCTKCLFTYVLGVL
jgi:hypothetical protein